MPVGALEINSTHAKTGTYVRDGRRWTGIPVIFYDVGAVAEITNRRIVSIMQVTATGKLVALVGFNGALAGHTFVANGVIEQAGQTGLTGNESADGQTFNDGDLVTVIAEPTDVYMIDVDPANAPTEGIASCRVDEQGRLSSVAAAEGIREFTGSIWSAVGGFELKGQLLTNTKFTFLRV